MKLGTEQLANSLKNIKVNLHNKALGHYREMAWLPFQQTSSVQILKSTNQLQWGLKYQHWNIKCFEEMFSNGPNFVCVFDENH